MSFDKSRLTFDPFKDYSAVVMEQGRVQTDADWNEALAENSRRARAATLDTMGHAVYPVTTPNGFKIDIDTTSSGQQTRIGLGRMYVDGILVENHGPESTAMWDSALGEHSNTPQPQPSAPQTLDATNSILFQDQPYGSGVTPPTAPGSYMAYLDVWERPITYIQDLSLVDIAIGVDTTGRLQTAWRVGLTSAPHLQAITGSVTSGSFLPNEQVVQAHSNASGAVIGSVAVAGPLNIGTIAGTPNATDTWLGQQSQAVFTPTAAPALSPVTCSTPDSSIPWPVSSGTLTTQPASSAQTGPCCLTSGGSYTGAENQLYRIEIHTAGGAGGAGATFKWSRENASVQTSVTAIGSASNTLGGPASSLTVQSLGRDQVLGFHAGDWIEITDEFHDNYCLPGELYKIDRVDLPSQSLVLTTQLSSTFSTTTLANNKWTRIIRWDQAGQVYQVSGGSQQPFYNLDGTTGSMTNGSLGIPIPTDGSPVVLENGIAIVFGLSLANGSYQAMDFWSFTARSADGSIQPLTNAPARGIAHHFTKLAIVTIPASGSAGASDCRTLWPPATSTERCCCCSVTVGDNHNSFGQFTSIQKAIDSVADGGEVCILAGDYFEQVFIESRRNLLIHGCGSQTRISSPSLSPSAAQGNNTGSGTTAIDVPAVFSIAHSVDIRLESFSIFADDGNIGVLLDRLSASNSGHTENDTGGRILADVISNRNIGVTNLELSASTMPSIAAFGMAGFKVCGNTIAMENVVSIYPAVYMAGDSILFERNQVGITSGRAFETEEQTPATDQQSAPIPEVSSFTASAAMKSGGGIQVGGPSSNVWLVENQILGARRNGITLGNIVFLDLDGNDSGIFAGMQLSFDEACAPGGSSKIPATHQIDHVQTHVGAGPAIRNLHILRNQIRNTGMCGIGPVGFFDLSSSAEIITLTNVLIAENLLVNTLQGKLNHAATDFSSQGYGVITLPDVQNLLVCDNIVSDYGTAPGDEVCGIYIFHGEGIAVLRNQIRESRDLSLTPATAFASYAGRRAGIFIEHVTPPPLDTSSTSLWIKSMHEVYQSDTADQFRMQLPAYVPGYPALRITDNVVRVAYGLALHALGFGPFSILGNHFATGGTVAAEAPQMRSFEISNSSVSDIGTVAAALTVAVVNLGTAIEAFDFMQSFDSLYNGDAKSAKFTGNALAVTNGTVLFSNNTCQLITQLNRVRGFCSVGIMSLDHVMLSNNELSINGRAHSAGLDAWVMGLSVQAVGNRMQEALLSVFYSAFTFGMLNVTANNLSTYCLIPLGAKPEWLVKTPNVIMDYSRCADLVANN